MTERLADISARIVGVRQLGAVVNAMKGIAAARAHVARTQVKAVDSYAANIAAAMARAIGPQANPSDPRLPETSNKTSLLMFCAEQGFVGTFSERLLDSIDTSQESEHLFLIGTRGISIAASRGITASWSAAMSSHTASIPKLADQITQAVYQQLALGQIDRVDVAFTAWEQGQAKLVRQTLFPIDWNDLPTSKEDRPLMQLSLESLIERLSQDYFHAQICKAALHAFSAENEARIEAMSSAANQIAQELDEFESKLRQVRQEAITAEIIELGTGATSAGNRR